MNAFMQDQWPMYEGTHAMRTSLLDVLTDADLIFSPGGQTMPLGALLREFGEIEHAYVESLKTFKQDFNYRNTEPGLERSLARLRAWYRALDADMQTTLAGLSDEDLKKTIARGGFAPTVDVQMQIYLQALLIFFGKATIYLRAMNRPLPQTIQEWIG
jgi:hypothetical protein